MPFDRDIWMSHGAEHVKPYPRRFMADGFLQDATLKGLTTAQVTEMLGDPGNHGYFKDYDLVYWLGPERMSVGIDSEWLAITIAKKTGRVEDYRIVMD
ncbi:hypothetical protein AzCIB_1362 [Azoarcus sp. CIB]|uniref:hypothetical protein n=1 Tax=Aromatoleum sp. (strain CIB) TaxID=198107 RepID=UPI00067CD358|nr:hypothetical protein [Azoarcus sp. CIB]AKU11267.1 hypothetical protein AzCIB_1362 [Azoarcus sp. CIB]